MAGRIARALEAGLLIRPGERRRVALMSLYAANAIGAVVIGHSVRDALYLSNRPARGLAGMYIWSSIAIVLVSWFYARIADRLPRGLLNAASAIGCAALGAALWAILTVTDAVWVYAALYIFVEAMGSLVVIQFWTLANDVFHAREAKRLFGLIGGGGTLANVIFGLLVGRYAQVVGAHNLLLLMVAQLALCAGLAQAGSRMAAAGPPLLRSRPVRKAPVLSRAGLTFLSNKHLTIVALIGAVSAAAVTIVDFQFKLSAAAVLDENDLAGYFGRFYGVCGGVALAVQIWVTGRLLERYGILASLLPLPLGLALGSVTSAASATPGLLVSSLAKGSDTIFRYTINDASMQLLYAPVPPHVRGRAKAFIDGVLKPTAVALAGAVLLFYKQSGGRGRPLTAAVLVLVGAWVWLLLRARGEDVRAAALGAVCAIEQEAAVPTVLPFLDVRTAPEAVVRAAAAVALIRHAGIDGVLAAAEPLKQLLGAGDPRDRAAAADALGRIGVGGFFRPLLAFLRDPDLIVRRAAIAASGKLRASELVAALVEQFQRRETALEAVSALAAFGPGIEGALEAILLDEASHVDCRRGVALVLQRLATREAADALVSALICREPAVRKAAARSLARLTRRHRGVRIEGARIERAVHVELAGARMVLSIFKKLPLPAAGHVPRTAAELLGMALLEERDARVLQALVLLEVLLPRVRVDVVAENLRSESGAARGNAIEVLDNALPEPWKREVMANLEESKRRGDQVVPDGRPVAEIAEEQPLAAGDQVFAQGETGDALYLIVEGKVKVHQGSKELVRLGERDVFGEMAVLDSEPRSASVTAVEDSVLLKIGRDDFRDILGERPEIAMGVMKVLTRRLRETSRK